MVLEHFSAAGVPGQIVGVIKRGGGSDIDAWPVTEVSELIHIQPDSSDIDLLPKMGEYILPILAGIGMEEVNKVDIPSPHLALVI